jgi:hypothetical protein
MTTDTDVNMDTDYIIKNNNEKINTLESQFYSALDDYKQTYILYNKNMNNDEYNRLFNVSSIQLDSIIKDAFVFSKDIEKQTYELTNYVNNLDTRIKNNKNINKDFIYKLGQITGSTNGSNILNSNSKELYKYQYISNWTMFLGIFLIINALYYVFKKPQTSI